MLRRGIRGRGRGAVHRPEREFLPGEALVSIERSEAAERLAAARPIAEPATSSGATTTTSSRPTDTRASTASESSASAPTTSDAPTSSGPWWETTNEDERSIRQREDEAKRRVRMYEAELGAQQAAEAVRLEKQKEEEVNRAEKRARWLEAASRRMGAEKFEGASRKKVEKLPRIPRRDVEVSEVCSLEHLSLDSTEAEGELENYLLQSEKPRASVSPNVTRLRTLPIEKTQPSDEPMEWDDDAIPVPSTTTTSLPARSQRSRSRSRSSRRPTPPPVVIGPPGVPAWELKGSIHSAPGEGRHRKKNKPYNPRRHLSIDDYVSGRLSDEEMAERIAQDEWERKGARPESRSRHHYREESRGEKRARSEARREELYREKDWRKSETVDRRSRRDQEEDRRRSRRDQEDDKRRRDNSAKRSPGERGKSSRSHDRREEPRSRSISRPRSSRDRSVGEKQLTWSRDLSRIGVDDASTGAVSRDPRLRGKSRELPKAAETTTTAAASTSATTTEEEEDPFRYPYGHHYVPTVKKVRDEYDPPSGGCHNCWSPYHRRMDCTRARSKYCKNCGRRDVHISECPRCSYDYPGWYAQDRARRRQKSQMLKDGTWERDFSLHRGTHLPPHQGAWSQHPAMRPAPIPSATRPPRAPTPPRPSQSAPKQSASMQPATPSPRAPTPPRPTTTPAAKDSGTTSTKAPTPPTTPATSASLPGESGLGESRARLQTTAPAVDEPEPYDVRLQRLLAAIGHLSPEMQAKIIEPMVIAESLRLQESAKKA